MPTTALRPVLARDGIFNVRDLGGTPVAGGRVRPGVVVRADALHRCGTASVTGLHRHGIRLVLDLRDDTERDHEGVFDGAGIEVEHLPVLDPAYRWDHDTLAPGDQLAHRYREILGSFAPRFTAALERIADAPGGVAYHCAVGKDRTGLLTALLLGAAGGGRRGDRGGLRPLRPGRGGAGGVVVGLRLAGGAGGRRGPVRGRVVGPARHHGGHPGVAGGRARRRGGLPGRGGAGRHRGVRGCGRGCWRTEPRRRPGARVRNTGPDRRV